MTWYRRLFVLLLDLFILAPMMLVMWAIDIAMPLIDRVRYGKEDS